jgi:hypothetical protein
LAKDLSGTEKNRAESSKYSVRREKLKKSIYLCVKKEYNLSCNGLPINLVRSVIIL